MPTADGTLMRRLAPLLRRRSVRERLLAPVGFDALVLVANLVTGVIVARALGPDGRGELTAILIVTQMAGWIFSLGSTEGITFRLARHPEDGARLLGSWLAVSVPLSIAAIGGGELLLPVLFAAQTESTLDLARIYLLTVTLQIIHGVVTAILLGDQDFYFFNFTRVAAPALIGLAYVCLLLTDGLSVESAVIVNAGATAAALTMAATRAVRRHGLDGPDLPLLRTTIWYGLRAHSGALTGLVNTRVDLLVVPAFLSAGSVGLYSVATNVTSIIITLTGTAALFVFPVAARRREMSAATVIRTVHAIFAIGLTIAIALAILAEVALALVYGSEFRDAATALRLLLPGSVLYAAAVALWSGLLAADRPFLSTATEGTGAVLTVAGLLLFLESGGITAAAVVSTCAYATVFAMSLVLYRRVAKLRWRDFVLPSQIPSPGGRADMGRAAKSGPGADAGSDRG
jgi:O-antigen/teichoic acid export membrane protein